jgi:hypothetical protein
MSPREVFLSDADGFHIFHAEEFPAEEYATWRWTEPGMRGMAKGNWQSLISWIDNKIQTLDCGNLDIRGRGTYDCAAWFDKALRNRWIGNEYLASNEYLVRLIPRSTARTEPGPCSGSSCDHVSHARARQQVKPPRPECQRPDCEWAGTGHCPHPWDFPERGTDATD